jgi:hypothetical protein
MLSLRMLKMMNKWLNAVVKVGAPGKEGECCRWRGSLWRFMGGTQIKECRGLGRR